MCIAPSRLEDPEGLVLAELETAAGLVVPYSAARLVGFFHQGVQPLRPSWITLDNRRRFGRDVGVLLLDRPSYAGDEPALLMVVTNNRLGCLDRVVVMEAWPCRLSLDGFGWPWCALGRFTEPRGILGGLAPILRPRHGVGRASFSWGSLIENLAIKDVSTLEACSSLGFMVSLLTSIPPGVPKVLAAQISRPGSPGRGDVRLTRSPTFGCGA
ncbi:unnamed protein product, partial [Prunus brigantina]